MALHFHNHPSEWVGYHRFPGQVGSFEVFYSDEYSPDESLLERGWYWWACFPGCLPDGEPSGPFKTAKEAHNDAMKG
jgi:hypothetical protein